MVAVVSTCAAAWPRRRAATIAVMTFNSDGPQKGLGGRKRLRLGTSANGSDGPLSHTHSLLRRVGGGGRCVRVGPVLGREIGRAHV